MTGADDEALFRQAMAGINPLKTDRVFRKSPPPRPGPGRAPEEDAKSCAIRDLQQCEFTLDNNSSLAFARAGIQHRQRRKLARGAYSITGKIDLHGMNVDEARKQLCAFLAENRSNRSTVVLVVHGRGLGGHTPLPILKNQLDSWLRQLPEVLAFNSARPEDGGAGALYVLIRRR